MYTFHIKKFALDIAINRIRQSHISGHMNAVMYKFVNHTYFLNPISMEQIFFAFQFKGKNE